MTSGTLDAAVLAAFLAACAWLGLRRRREDTAEGWLLAGRSLTAPALAASLIPTFYGGALGIGEFTWTQGLSNWTVMALPYYAFAAVYAFLLAGKVRLAPGRTIPDHLESAYGRPAALLGALLVFVLACPADELLMARLLLGHAFGLPAAAAAAAAAVLALALVWRGGFASNVSANKLQIVFMFGGFAVILPFALGAVGGPAALAARLPPGHLDWTGGMSAGRIAAWWLIAAWTLVDPSFHQRCAAAESPVAARRGVLLSIAGWAVFDLMSTTAGLYARAALPALEAPALAYPLLADAVLPPVARGLFLAGIASSLFAALQGTALLAGASLGRDGLGRALGAGEDAARRWTRPALAAAVAAAWLLSNALPSVPGLWYAVGSCAIPGLLLPMLGVYLPGLRAPGGWAAFAAAAGPAAAALRLWTGAPAALEPMHAGLAVSAAIWAAGYASSRRADTAPPSSTPHAQQ